MVAASLAASLLGTTGYAVAQAPGHEPRFPSFGDTVTVTSTRTVTVHERYRGRTARSWAREARYYRRQLQAANSSNTRLRRRWQPTVVYALRLASAVYGVSYSDLARVSYCESTWNPAATNGRYQGLFQLGWSPFGMDPFDPVANALSAAATVVHDGSWRQWSCKP